MLLGYVMARSMRTAMLVILEATSVAATFSFAMTLGIYGIIIRIFIFIVVGWRNLKRHLMRDTALLAVMLVSLFIDAIGTVFLTLNSSDLLVLPILPILGVFWHLVLIKVKGIRLV